MILSWQHVHEVKLNFHPRVGGEPSSRQDAVPIAEWISPVRERQNFLTSWPCALAGAY